MKNTLILAPVIAGIITAGYFLFKDYHQGNINSEEFLKNKEVIGEIIYAENNVKRQFNGDLLWNGIDKKVPVYNQDSIRTGKDSSVGIRLLDKTVLEVNENSLIVLDKSQNMMNINFKAGDIQTKNSGDNLQIQVKDNIVKGQGADFKIKAGMDRAKVEVTKGKATINDKNNKQMSLQENEETFLNEKGVGDIIKIAVQLRSPENKAQITSNEREVLYPFTWNVLTDKINSEYFEISNSNKFLKDHTKVFKAHQAITAPANSGSNYWRVGWDDPKKGKVYSEIRQLTIGQDKRLELIYPENGTSFQMVPDENVLELQWKSLLQAKAFTLEISRTEDFKVLVNTQTVKGQAGELKAVAKNLESGHYFWRVKAFGEKNDLLAASAIHDFAIKIKLPQLPELIYPSDDHTWSDASPVKFSWKKIDKILEYRIVISSDQDQRNVVKSVTTKETSYIWNSKLQQVVYWSVMAISQKSTIVAHSEIRRLTIQAKKKSPAFNLINPKDGYEVQRDLKGEQTDPVLFQWKIMRPLPGPITLLISTDEEFKKPMEFNNIKKYSYEVKLEKEGTYFWRLESRSATQKDLVEASDTYSFNLKHVSLIAPPTLLTPDVNEKIEITDALPVKFTWKEAQGAVQYHIIVEKEDPKTTEKKTVMDKVLKESTITSQPLPEGQYTWSVSSFDGEAQEGMPSRSRIFNVVPVEQVAAPQLNNPVVK